MKTQLLEKINIFNPKVQGEFFEAVCAKEFAEKRCKELAERRKDEFFYVINPSTKDGFPTEIYESTAISQKNGFPFVSIGIYRKRA